MTRRRCPQQPPSTAPTSTAGQAAHHQPPIALLAAEHVDLDRDNERRAVELLADLLADTAPPATKCDDGAAT